MKDLVLYMVKGLVDKPEAVSATEVEGDKSIVLELKVDPSDIGRVIGKQGKAIRAIRLLASAKALKKGKRVTIELLD